MSSGLKLVIVTPEASVLAQSCDSAQLPASLGYVTILPRHTPFVSTLAVGVLSYHEGGKTSSLALSGGFFEVSEDVVTVLADSAQLPADIDVAASRQALEEASSAMGRLSGHELHQARLTVELSRARIAVAG